MKTLIFLIPVLFLLNACGSEIETISIGREGILAFNVEGYDDTWESNTYKIYPGPNIVKIFPGTPSESIIFKRYFIVFYGENPEGATFELTVAVDLAGETDMKHIYTTTYAQQNGGLSEISLILTDADNKTITLAELCEDTAGEANFTILRQDLGEKLIAGTMEAELCIQDSTDNRLIIYNAEFKDINYKE